jgi:putative acetyltransferase
MNIRRFQPTDLDEVLLLFRQTVLAINARDYTEEQVSVWAPDETDRERLAPRLAVPYTLVAENAGKITGFGTLTEDGIIDFLYVHKDHQRQGIATRILSGLEREARLLGLSTLTTEASITAKPFFVKRGFRVIRKQVKEHRGMEFLQYLMEKSLE